MCAPDQRNGRRNNDGTTEPRRVVVCGAGPAGLLLTALLLQRNADLGQTLYQVTLIDSRENFGKVSLADLKANHRSWMLGLAGHGCQALRTCQYQTDDNQTIRLFQDYCQDVGISLTSFSIHMGSKEFETTSTQLESIPENFIVDRNFVVAAMARFIQDCHGESPDLTTHYQHKVQYVDYEQRQVLVRNSQSNGTTSEFYVPYDLLVGCDGVRSVVREAMVKRHSDFEMDVGDIFQTFKAVHVRRPDCVKEASMHVLPACFPHMQGIALPETGGMLNISVGVPRHLFDDLPEALKSDDYKVVAQYVKDNFKPFELEDYDDFAKQWVNQRWNRTGQVHCSTYHSTDINVVLMGDAAHATSPSIGMGMNQSLKDAQTFYQLLDQYKDDLNQVMPAFSKARVKEGNSLTDLAMHLYCFDTKVQGIETLHMIVRGTLHKWFPKWVNEHPQGMIGLPEYNLSDVYDHSVNLNIIPKHRRINQKIRQDFFERQTGMVQSKESCWWKRPMVWAAASGVVFAMGKAVIAQ